MANEVFTRTPTSSGNRKTFTWAGWIKRNSLNSQGGNFFQGILCVGTVDGAEDTFTFSGDNLRLRCEVGTDIQTTAEYRDSGNWMHVMMVVNTTLYDPDHRCIFYVNGVKSDVMTDEGDITQNADLRINSTSTHYLGEFPRVSEHLDGQITDVFFVDGQALTPDVFGFYKDGDGYISVGSEQATDFRPGQWMPHSPSIIKKSIERSGGFGVNGFYLPMNDSSNPGADFHCAPNSIITLKGEDLPQPRNGAPTTSDAYVSQLRTDPYAANLVLAVPGISTSTSANLITNGTFDNGTSNWTADSDATLTNPDGVLRITVTSTAGASQTISVVSGKRYTLSFKVRTDGTNFANFSLDLGGTVQYAGNQTSTDWTTVTKSFTSNTTGNATLKPYKATSGWVEFDDIVFKQEDAPLDYSADIKGSGTNKTLTANGNAGVGYELGNYYGSAMTFDGTGDAFSMSVPNNDALFLQSDFTIECWAKIASGITDDRYFVALLSGSSTNSQTSWYLRIYNSKFQGAFINGNDQYLTASASDYVADQWNHIVYEREGNVQRLFINGVCDSTTTHSVLPNINNSSILYIGSSWNLSNSIDAEIQDVRIYDSVAKYKGGFDVSKPYTPVGIEAFRTTADICKNNFATLNPLIKSIFTSGDRTISNGNLTATTISTGTQNGLRSTIATNSGKWYVEVYVSETTISTVGFIGVTGIGEIDNQNGSAGDHIYYYGTGQKYDYVAGTLTSSASYGSTYTAGDIISVLINADNGEVTFYKNNVSQGVAKTFPSSKFPLLLELTDGGSNATATYNVNFGQNPTFSGQLTAGTFTDSNGKGLFKYEPPSGFLALCEDNLPTPAIADPGKHFKAVLYTNRQKVSGVGFKPDLVWHKSRNQLYSHYLYDSVRGVGGTGLNSDSTAAEGTNDANGILSFDDDGFTWSDDAGLSETQGVAWCWKAGGAAVSNSDGTIISQVSVNQDAGFSIATWTGNALASQTIGHGLGKTPDFYIWKSRDNARNWHCAHTGLTAYNYTLYLDTTAAEVNNDKVYAAPTSTVISPSQSNTINGSGEDYVGYFWAEIEGFSKFGSYVGNGDADGPFVYCGFKPAWVMIRAVNSLADWVIMDSSRSSTNPNKNLLYANTNGVEQDGIDDRNPDLIVDFLSNGFKCRSTNNDLNNTEDYIFAAFAESPFQTANAK